MTATIDMISMMRNAPTISPQEAAFIIAPRIWNFFFAPIIPASLPVLKTLESDATQRRSEAATDCPNRARGLPKMPPRKMRRAVA